MSEKYFRFASINHAETIAYVFDADHWDYSNRGYAVADFLRQYDTYGDGMTAHSPNYAVAKENFGDVCASLAKHILGGNLDEEQMEKVSNKIGVRMCGHEIKDFEFFAKLKHDPDAAWDKRVYVNLDERKKSTAASKEHDKRWMRTSEWMDGSVNAIFRLMCEKHKLSELIDKFDVYCQLADWLYSQEIRRGDNPAEFFGIHSGSEWQDEKQNKTAWETLKTVCDSYRMRKDSERYLAGYLRNVENFATAKAEKKTA